VLPRIPVPRSQIGRAKRNSSLSLLERRSNGARLKGPAAAERPGNVCRQIRATRLWPIRDRLAGGRVRLTVSTDLPQVPNVLVVEDEMILRMRAVDIVEDAGFCPVEAINADEAISILESR
jgi:hypothetical protein